MKLDLEVVVEDASDEVYSFEIQRSLIYLKFVWIAHHIIISYYQYIDFYQNPSQGGIILRNLIMLNCVWVPAVKLFLPSSLRKVNMCKYPPIGSIIILPDDVYKSSKIMLPKEGLCL